MYKGVKYDQVMRDLVKANTWESNLLDAVCKQYTRCITLTSENRKVILKMLKYMINHVSKATKLRVSFHENVGKTTPKQMTCARSRI